MAWSMPIHSTTVVVVWSNGQIYIGADGKRQAELVGGQATVFSACKIQHYGTIVSHYGLTRIEDQADSTGRFFLPLDSDKMLHRAALTQGPLTTKADRLEQEFWPLYQAEVRRYHRFPRSQWPYFELSLHDIGFVLAGKGRNGLPEAIILDFSTDFQKPNPQPNKLRWSVPYDKTEVLMGQNDLQYKPFGFSPNEDILAFLQREAAVHSDNVGPPYVIARLDNSSTIHFDQPGACKQQ